MRKVHEEAFMSKKKSKKNKRAESPCCGGSSSCCCASTGASPAQHQDYSCNDESYRGRMHKVVVDFLYLDVTCCDRCQGADKRVEAAVERCRGVLAACGYEIVLNPVLVNTAELAEQHRFESSPTVRVNGVDVCPSVEENDCTCCTDICDAPVTCRLFPFNGTYYEVPPTDMLVRAIMETVLQNRRPADPPLPYALPDNLRRFYEGVEKKARKGSCCCDGNGKKPHDKKSKKKSCCCGDDGSKGSCCCGGKRKKGHKRKKHGKKK